MNPNAVKDHLRESPFVPFAIVTNAGTRYPVQHPEFVVPTRQALHVYRMGSDGLADPAPIKIGYTTSPRWNRSPSRRREVLRVPLIHISIFPVRSRKSYDIWVRPEASQFLWPQRNAGNLHHGNSSFAATNSKTLDGCSHGTGGGLADSQLASSFAGIGGFPAWM